ncbi:hypothetical protein [Hymenobacter rubripertinctus]|uniref:Uncharacterized protein n=1 Tax=Hymenobacter rubripertinctus TaxID=2029981 RepID=A0A418R787_9BACT|nr:hypothetical protein [Hymenobacter rubripertinctus]RIY13266.1 hypothetical protein D0T11_02190 [Hymenobacter rubripertinctus]
MATSLTKLLDFPDDHLFWFGSAFRCYNVGMSNVTPEDDYYDYLLVDPQGEEYMMVVNATVGNVKAGYVPFALQIARENGNAATAHEVRRVMGSEQVFYLG